VRKRLSKLSTYLDEGAPEKRNDAYRCSFVLIDLKTGFYSGYGYSSRSEKEAYERAIAMAREMGIPISSIRLDIWKEAAAEKGRAQGDGPSGHRPSAQYIYHKGCKLVLSQCPVFTKH